MFIHSLELISFVTMSRFDGLDILLIKVSSLLLERIIKRILINFVILLLLEGVVILVMEVKKNDYSFL